MLSQTESVSIALKGSMNPTVHHPSWYYTIGQLSKEDVAHVIDHQELRVTSRLSKFDAPLFGITCDKKRWRVKTWDKTMGLRILHLTLKTFDDLLPETLLEQFSFKFAFSIEVSHERTVDFLSKLMRGFVQVEGKGKISSTVLSTTHTDQVRQRKVQLRSFPGANRALLTFSFYYPITDERVFTLKQMSMTENFELDHEEATTEAEQIAHKLVVNTAGVETRKLEADSN